ncbi:small multi-drug export protein [bacterium]|nr:small multi-drug export protein [bacterium]
MTEQIAGLFIGLPKEAVTLLLAMLPVTELRGSIPWATFALDMPWYQAYLWSIIGNFLPVPIILKFLRKAEHILSRWEFFELFFQWLYSRTQRRGRVIEKYRALGLIMFVAIPLPITGAWTGSVAAHIFGIKFWRALICIAAGICVAGIVVTLACQGFIGVWDLSMKF